MRTIQMTLDDQVVKTIETTRSAFIRDALRQALKQFKALELEKTP